MISLLTLSFTLLPAVFSLSCLDANGDSTDSWSIFKAPQTADSYLYATGREALYAPSSSLNSTTEGALSKTMNQLWNSDTSYVVWNDEIPNSETYNYTVGHSKGLFALADDGTGFYLIHSIPQFPQGPRSSSSYTALGHNAWTYGQNMYCFSTTGPYLDTLAYALHLVVPNIYDFSLSPVVQKTYTNITSLTQGRISKAAICVFYTIYTQGGEPHLFFSKSTQWNKDLWFSCVAPTVKEDLIVESWIRGSAIGPSCSSSYTVNDVTSVSFSSQFSWTEYNDRRAPKTESEGDPFSFSSQMDLHAESEGDPFSFSSQMDHSKWATNTNGSLTCHGDINRMTTQFARGGTATCFSNPFYNLEKAIAKENICD